MFSKALFKQSCKANGTMWSIITVAVCFMLACVMLISGNGNIGEVKNSIQDTIIVKEVDAGLEKRAVNYYNNAVDGLWQFDRLFAANATDTLSYLTWLSAMPKEEQFTDPAQYMAAMQAWQSAKPEPKTEAGKSFENAVTEWQGKKPDAAAFTSAEAYMAAMAEWAAAAPASAENAVTIAYTMAANDLQEYVYGKALAVDPAYTRESNEAKEMLGSVMYALNPNGMFNESFYLKHEKEAPAEYDYMSVIAHIQAGDADEYIAGEERSEYRAERAESCSSMFLAGNMTEPENVEKIVGELAAFGVTMEKYNSFGYTYASIKHLANTTVITYGNRLEYEMSLLAARKANGEFANDAAYNKAVADMSESLAAEVSGSLLSSLPTEVSDALEEVGKADLYTLIVGSIFYKLAGLLLPIIYMIMASNNLIAGQVDSGSMAYVLSTSTKRSTVVFTQAVYLVGSLLAMFALTTVTGCVCLSIVTEDVSLTYGNLILLNLGAFLVLFALSGLCFFTSCWFDRSKRSMAIGGGLSIFALVAAMLGLFGSPVIPSVVRLDSLNNFNYTTIITLFDVISIMDGTNAFIWKFAILAVLGLTGYIVGSVRFTKKDLPL